MEFTLFLRLVSDTEHWHLHSQLHLQNVDVGGVRTPAFRKQTIVKQCAELSFVGFLRKHTVPVTHTELILPSLDCFALVLKQFYRSVIQTNLSEIFLIIWVV